MGIGRRLLLRMFGRPRGLLGRLGGAIMARMNGDCGAWIAGLMEVAPGDRVLEIGFGPGVVVGHLARLASKGRVAGADPSPEMVAQARARNAPAVADGRVDLRCEPAERLSFADESFDRAMAVNSLQVWQDPPAGLHEIRRVLRPGGRLALGFTPQSGQGRDGLTGMLADAGFIDARIEEKDGSFCVVATRT